MVKDSCYDSTEDIRIILTKIDINYHQFSQIS